jgi:hypothetical protein
MNPSSLPLRIDCLTSPLWPGTIAMTLCPGRKGTSEAFGRWDRDLTTDLSTIEAWRTAIAISLLENQECAMLGIPHFKEAVAAAGMPWFYLPIRDAGVPARGWEEAWYATGPGVRNALRDGAHERTRCLAGRGDRRRARRAVGDDRDQCAGRVRPCAGGNFGGSPLAHIAYCRRDVRCRDRPCTGFGV